MRNRPLIINQQPAVVVVDNCHTHDPCHNNAPNVVVVTAPPPVAPVVVSSGGFGSSFGVFSSNSNCPNNGPFSHNHGHHDFGHHGHGHGHHGKW